jgi:hypothetical protein
MNIYGIKKGGSRKKKKKAVGGLVRTDSTAGNTYVCLSQKAKKSKTPRTIQGKRKKEKEANPSQSSHATCQTFIHTSPN